jgi:hypothetical protein
MATRASRSASATFLVAFVFCAAPASATVIAQWSFETTVPTTAGPFAPEAGSGEASGGHASGSTAYSNPQGSGSTESFSADHWAVNDYWQFKVNSTGFENIKFGWDQVSSSTGPRDFNLSWSTDGTSFNLLGSYTILENTTPNSWTSTVKPNTVYGPVTAPAGVDNQSAVYFRLIDTSTTSASGGTVNVTSGANRVDNVIISGDVTGAPEPSCIMLVLATALLTRRRYQRGR